MYCIHKTLEAADGNDVSVWVPSTLSWGADTAKVSINFTGYYSENAYREGSPCMGAIHLEADISKQKYTSIILERIRQAVIVNTGSFLHMAKPAKFSGVSGIFLEKAVPTEVGRDATIWKEGTKILYFDHGKVRVRYEGYKDRNAVQSGKTPLTCNNRWSIRDSKTLTGQEPDHFLRNVLESLVKTKSLEFYCGKVRDL